MSWRLSKMWLECSSCLAGSADLLGRLVAADAVHLRPAWAGWWLLMLCIVGSKVHNFTLHIAMLLP